MPTAIANDAPPVGRVPAGGAVAGARYPPLPVSEWPAGGPYRLLDLFCGAGGCAVGYYRAGFTDITGVDLAPQPRYPFHFIQWDALEFLEGVKFGQYDLIHASPPCQGYSRMRHLPWLKGREYPMLIDATRKALQKIGTPWVIENVEDAPLSGVTLCGAAFGLKVYRHRRFESSELIFSPHHPKHTEVIGRGRMLNDRAQPNEAGWVSLPSKGKLFAGRVKTSKGTLNNNYAGDGMISVGGHNFKREVAAAAMGIDWMNRAELAQAIPPAFTAYIGSQLLPTLRAAP